VCASVVSVDSADSDSDFIQELAGHGAMVRLVQVMPVPSTNAMPIRRGGDVSTGQTGLTVVGTVRL
jgi:hypothetical protein